MTNERNDPPKPAEKVPWYRRTVELNKFRLFFVRTGSFVGFVELAQFIKTAAPETADAFISGAQLIVAGLYFPYYFRFILEPVLKKKKFKKTATPDETRQTR